MTMKVFRRLDTPEAKKFWKFVDRVAREVERWPDWKKGLAPISESEMPNPQKAARREKKNAKLRVPKLDQITSVIVVLDRIADGLFDIAGAIYRVADNMPKKPEADHD